MSTADMNQLLNQVKGLVEAAGEARLPQVVPLSGYPAHIVPLFEPSTKQVRFLEAPPAPKAYVAGDVADLARMVDEMAGRDAFEYRLRSHGPLLVSSAPKSALKVDAADDGIVPIAPGNSIEIDAPKVFVFVYKGNVEVVLDEQGDRRDRMRLTLAPAGGYAELKKLDGQWLDQVDMINALRTSINGGYNPPNIVGILRELEIKGSTDGVAVRQTGKASLGKTIQMAVESKVGKLPDDLSITLPLFDDFLGEDGRAVTFTLNASFDIDVGKQLFRLDVKAGEYARVELEADTLLQQRLASLIKNEKGNVRIFRGNPN